MNKPIKKTTISEQATIQTVLESQQVQSLLSLTRNRRAPLWILCFSMAAIALLHIPLSVFPLGRDQGVWTTAGLAMDAGYVFFKDFMHFNLPGLGISFWALFQYVDSPHIATMLVSLLGSLSIVVALFLLLRHCVSNTVAMITVMMFAIRWPTLLNYWTIAQKDYLAMSGVLWGTWLLARSDDKSPHRRLSIYLSGVAIGCAIMYKPVFGIAGIFLAIAHWLRLADITQHGWFGLSFSGLKKLILDYVLLAMGPATVLLAFAFYLYKGDALQNAYEGIFIFAPAYAGIFSQNLTYLIELLIFYALFIDYSGHPLWAILVLMAWLPSIAIGWHALFRKKYGAKPNWLYIPLFTSLFTFIIQSKGFNYHAQPWQVCLFYLSSTGIVWLWHRMNELQIMLKSLEFVFTAVTTFGLALIIFIHPLTFSSYAQVTVPAWFGFIPRDQYLLDNYGSDDSPNPKISEELASWIQSNTTSEDKILVWGLECQLYSLSNRLFATSSPFDVILTTDSLITRAATEWQAKERALFIAQLKSQLPKFIIVTSQDVNPIEPVSSKDAIAFIPGFSELLESDYLKFKDWERFEIYQRKHI